MKKITKYYIKCKYIKKKLKFCRNLPFVLHLLERSLMESWHFMHREGSLVFGEVVQNIIAYCWEARYCIYLDWQKTLVAFLYLFYWCCEYSTTIVHLCGFQCDDLDDGNECNIVFFSCNMFMIAEDVSMESQWISIKQGTNTIFRLHFMTVFVY